MLVLQATNAGVRRTGYKAMPRQFLYLQHCSLNKVHIVDAAIVDCTLDGSVVMGVGSTLLPVYAVYYEF